MKKKIHFSLNKILEEKPNLSERDCSAIIKDFEEKIKIQDITNYSRA